MVDKERSRFGDLHWRRCPIALTYTDRHSVALIPRCAMACDFPLTSRHVRTALFINIDTGWQAKAELVHPFRDAVDAKVKGSLVEERVHGFFNRFGDINITVTPTFPISPCFWIWFRARNTPRTVIVTHRRWRNHMFLKPRHCHEWFHGGCWRVNTKRSAVYQGVSRIVQ